MTELFTNTKTGWRGGGGGGEVKIGSRNLDWHKRGGGHGDHKHLDCQSFLSSPVSESLDDLEFCVIQFQTVIAKIIG